MGILWFLLGMAAVFVVVVLAVLAIIHRTWVAARGWKIVVAAAIILIAVWVLSPTKPTLVTTAAQIYPNYRFPEGVNQITVPLLPANQVLSREAGGWVITPAGSGYRIDYDNDVVIEYNDGRKVVHYPGKPAHDGVRPANGIFRIYGKEGDAVVTIHREVYVNRWRK